MVWLKRVMGEIVVMRGLYPTGKGPNQWTKGCSAIRPKLGLGSLFEIPIFGPHISRALPTSNGVGPQKGASHVWK